MSSSFIESVIEYIKADSTDMAVVNELCLAAVEKFELETGKMFDETSSLMALAVKMLVAEWFDHRGQTTTENLKEMPLATNLQSILNQVALSSDYKEVLS